MTTVIGLANSEIGIAVLCADRQSTMSTQRDNNPTDKMLGRKLWVSKDNLYAFGHSGMRSEGFEDFISEMVDGSINIEQAVKDRNFTKLRELNLKRLGTKTPDPEKLSSFLLATRFGEKPCLYNCWPLGDVEEFGLTYIGSGARKADEYFRARAVIQQAREYIAPNNDGSSKKGNILIAGLEALRYAQSIDIYSSGLDLVVVTPDKIIDHFPELQDDFRKRIEAITLQYKDNPPTTEPISSS